MATFPEQWLWTGLNDRATEGECKNRLECRDDVARGTLLGQQGALDTRASRAASRLAHRRIAYRRRSRHVDRVPIAANANVGCTRLLADWLWQLKLQGQFDRYLRPILHPTVDAERTAEGLDPIRETDEA
jgi:hypothetical protein